MNSRDIRFLVIGGLAAIRYGAPRSTRDIDIILMTENISKNFLDELEGNGYVSVEGITIAEFLKSQYTVFTTTVPKNGNEVGFWTKIDGFDFDDVTWGRREDEEINGEIIHFISPEDLVVSKLALSIGMSEIDEIDVFSVLAARCGENRFDTGYFMKRIHEEGLSDGLEKIREKIMEISEEDKTAGELLKKDLEFLF